MKFVGRICKFGNGRLAVAIPKELTGEAKKLMKKDLTISVKALELGDDE